MPIPSELDRLRVVLISTRNPLNMGAVARAMSNFGVRHLRVVNPYEKAFRDAVSAVGAEQLLASAPQFGSVAEAIADCILVVGTTAVRDRELHHVVRPLEEGAAVIRKQLTSGNVAILCGSEKVGLSNHDLSHCHWLMRIPTSDENISMNLGQAVAVCLYELIRDAERAKVQTGKMEELAPAGEVDRITLLLFEVLRLTRYWNPGAKAATEEKVRRLVRRLKLPAADSEVWLGILRQILWKIKSVKPE